MVNHECQTQKIMVYHEKFNGSYCKTLYLLKPIKNKSSPMTLTDRELEVLQLIVKEQTSEKIAETLHISLSTVESHRRNLFQKMEVSSVVGLIKVAVKQGFIKI
jgi:DNA-binding NarL/FixJ family response regulator